MNGVLYTIPSGAFKDIRTRFRTRIDRPKKDPKNRSERIGDEIPFVSSGTALTGRRVGFQLGDPGILQFNCEPLFRLVKRQDT